MSVYNSGLCAMIKRTQLSYPAGRGVIMDFLGIGPMEILVIIVIILIVFGPHRLPEMTRTIGKAMKNIRNATTDLGRSLTSELEEEEKKIKQEVKSVASDLSKNLDTGLPEIQEAKAALTPSSEEKLERDK